MVCFFHCNFSWLEVYDTFWDVQFGLGHRVIAEECGVFWPCSFRWTVLLLGRRSSLGALRVDWCIDDIGFIHTFFWRSEGIHMFFCYQGNMVSDRFNFNLRLISFNSTGKDGKGEVTDKLPWGFTHANVFHIVFDYTSLYDKYCLNVLAFPPMFFF